MSDRSPVVKSLKAQSEGVTPQQQAMGAFHDLILGVAMKRKAKRVTISTCPQGSLTVDYDFEGLDGVDG